MPSHFWKASGNALLPGSSIFATASAGPPISLPGMIALWVPDATHTYTDAGTTLVSADGQSVWQLNDQSGNSNHLLQATSANRPVYKTGSGKPYLQFTVANSTKMVTGSTVAAGDGSGQNYIGISGQLDSLTAANGIAFCTSVLKTFNGSGDSWVTASNGTSDFGPVTTAATPFTMIANTGTGTVEVFLNNTTDGATTNSTGLSTTATAFTLGFDSSEYMGGRVYGAVYGSGVLGSTDRGTLHTYLAGLHP